MVRLPPEIEKSFSSAYPEQQPAMIERRAAAVRSQERAEHIPQVTASPPKLVQLHLNGKPVLPRFLTVTAREPWHNLKHWGNLGIILLGKALSYASWVLSPRNDEATRDERNDICMTRCPFARKHDGGCWCPFCGCGHTKRADVRNKNERAGHNCPAGLHPGSKPEPNAQMVARKYYAQQGMGIPPGGT